MIGHEISVWVWVLCWFGLLWLLACVADRAMMVVAVTKMGHGHAKIEGSFTGWVIGGWMLCAAVVGLARLILGACGKA